MDNTSGTYNTLTEVPALSVGQSYETVTEHLLSTKLSKGERKDPTQT